MNTFPSPPPGRSGWPWTLPSEYRPGRSSDQPKITVITPSFNQGAFIEETIRSVLLQGYANVEYIVVDGGSTDETMSIVKKYEPWIAHWVSEPDQGQADAINKGLRRATGDIITWFSSDDIFAPEIFEAVALAWRKNPRAVYAAAVANFVSRERQWLTTPRGLTFSNVVEYWTRKAVWHDPGLFWSRAVVDAVGEIDATLRYSFDFDYLVRALKDWDVEYVDAVAAGFRLHPESKSISESQRMVAETLAVSRRYWPMLPLFDRKGFDRHELESKIWVCCSRIFRRSPGAIGAFWDLFRLRPSAVLARLPVLFPKMIYARVFRFRRVRSVRYV